MTPKAHLLIIDDDQNTLASLARAFRLAGYEATVAATAARALELLENRRFDLVLSDLVMPEKDGLALLEDLRGLGLTTPVVMMSGQATVEMAVRATRLGAADFLEKPLSTEKLLVTVENALRLARLERENRQLRDRLGRHTLVWTSAAMAQVMAQVERVAASETRACILGESGAGKELVARAIHENSPRRAGPFITLNCAAVPAELIESELFGHEKGSFTGAAARRLGKFEQAHGGTLFLDEIGDMPAPMQAKLLRVLEEGEIERVGGDRPIAVDARVLVATHRDLERMVREGGFRQDLFHRVFVFPLRLPPLRERREDLPVLVEHFCRQLGEQNGWKPKKLSPEAMKALESHAWPGNVRELRNVVERLHLLAASDEICADDVRRALPVPAGTESAAVAVAGSLARRLAGYEREQLLAELKRQNYHITNTAKALGLERSHLYKKCQQAGIDLRALRGKA